jgi:C4-dicarboxylate-specific signal transduction histidine kinase
MSWTEHIEEHAHPARIAMLGELTASIVHEVNQPLTAITIIGQTALRRLNRAEPDLEDLRALIKRMLSGTRRAADIIASVRGMAKRGTDARTSVSLHHIVQEGLAFVNHEIAASSVSVRFAPARALPEVYVDRTQMQQVVVNLAVNAVQAMTDLTGRPRTLSIRTAQTDANSVCCIFEDSGPGLQAEYLGRLFESYFTTKECGMGMGLAICRLIVEAHGGQIQADNESALGGARFSFALPTSAVHQ